MFRDNKLTCWASRGQEWEWGGGGGEEGRAGVVGEEDGW